MWHFRSSAWSIRYVVPVAAAYALLSWLPVGYLASTRGAADPLDVGRGLALPFSSVLASALVSAVLFMLAWWVMGRAWPGRSRWGRRVDIVCAVCLPLILVTAYLLYVRYVGYYAPVSDRATALQYGFEEFLAGRNPYSRHTQLDNTISPMLGGIIMAGPFVLAWGTMYWQGLTWLAATLAFLAWWRGPRLAFVAGVLLLVSPTMRLELAIQSDGWVNGAALAIVGTTLYALAGRHDRSHAWLAATLTVSALFGFALAYRFIYLVVVFPLGALIWRRFGARALLVTAVPAAIVSLVLILGPYFADPSVYAPFEKASLGTNDHSLPHLPLITAVACSLVAVGGAGIARTIAGVWGTMFAVSVVFIVLTGWGQGAWYQYLTWAFNGATLIFAFFAIGRTEPDDRLPPAVQTSREAAEPPPGGSVQPAGVELVEPLGLRQTAKLPGHEAPSAVKAVAQHPMRVGHPTRE